MRGPVLARRTLLGAGAAAAAAPALARRRAPGPDVVVLGAGLAGLETALRLEAAGARVLVLEARPRVGGRVESWRPFAGAPEAGGTGVGRGYRRFLARAAQAGLALLDAGRLSDFGGPDGQAIGWRGQLIAPGAWAGHAANPLAGAARALRPWEIGPRALAGLSNPLARAEDWRSPAHAGHDVPLADLLLGAGLDAQALHMGFGINPGYVQPFGWSALMAFHVQANLREAAAAGPGSLLVAGGNDRLPEAMAAQLRAPVRLGAEVVALRVGPSGVEAVLTSGERLGAAHAVCTLPLPALRQVALDPAPPPGLQAAIAGVPYNRVTKLLIEVRRPFWEADGLPRAMWTDTLAGRVFGVRPADGDWMLVAFVTGPAAERLERLPPGARGAAVAAAIEALRPAARGALAPLATRSWGDDPFAGGAYACWAPGQVSGLAPLFDRPWGRLWWAGEHAAPSARGLEGALESGEHVARRLAEA